MHHRSSQASWRSAAVPGKPYRCFVSRARFGDSSILSSGTSTRQIKRETSMDVSSDTGADMRQRRFLGRLLRFGQPHPRKRTSARSIVHILAAILLLAVAAPAVADLQFDPPNLDLGDASVGATSQSQTAVLRIVDASTEYRLAFTINEDSPFVADTTNCPPTLGIPPFPYPPSCEVIITFAPRELGPATGALTVTSSADPGGTIGSATATLNLTGNGTGGLLFEVSHVHLNADVGSISAPQTVALQLLGDVEATGLTFNAPGEGFEADVSDCGDSLPVGGICEVGITFSPTTAGTSGATLSVTSDQGLSSSLSLIGCGLEEAGANPHETVLVSQSECIKGNDHSSNFSRPSVSGDGRYVAFHSTATNLHPDDADYVTDIFVRDSIAHETILVSRASGLDGAKGNDVSNAPSISADGRYVAFASRASNLDQDDTDSIQDVFVRDLLTGDTILVSRATGADGSKGNGSSGNPVISADGRFVAFSSVATSLHPDDADDVTDIFVRDLITHETILVSRASGVDGVKGNGNSNGKSISFDGRYVAFNSQATNLHPDDADTLNDIFVRDLQTHETMLGSRATGIDGSKSNGGSGEPSISADGRYVTFNSGATNLHPDDADSTSDVFVRDLLTHEMSLVSRASGSDGEKGNNGSGTPSISGNGRFVAFQSNATNLHPEASDGGFSGTDVYVRDLQTDQTTPVSRASGIDGSDGNAFSGYAAISSNGRFVAYFSQATNLHPNDADALADVYRRDVLGSLAEAELIFNPSSLTFGDIEVGTSSAPLVATLQNIGSVEITGLTFDEPGNGFAVNTSDCGSILASGETCTIVVTFTPPDFGPFSATLTATSDQAPAVTLNLEGRGIAGAGAVLSFEPVDLDFGNVEVGDSGVSLTTTLRNSGDAAASGLAFTPLPAAFAVDAGACGNNIEAGASCPVSITFAPLAPGSIDLELRVSGVEGAMAVLGLAGVGIAPSTPILAFAPEHLDFGVVSTGTSSVPQPLVLTNSGDGDATGLIFSEPGGGFAADTSDCGDALPAGQSCTLSVIFTPGTSGGSDAALEVQSAERAMAVLGTSAPDKYLYFGTTDLRSAFRMDPNDLRSARSMFTPVPVHRIGNESGFAVDAYHCKWYWSGNDGTQSGHRLFSADIDGTNEEVLLQLPGATGDIELDAAGRVLYYTQGANIFRGNMGPGGLTNHQLVVTLPGGASSAGGLSLELDLGAGRLYVTGRASGIWSANLDGSDLQLVRDTSDEAAPPRGLALDLQAGKLYWGDGFYTINGQTPPEGSARIHRANLDGTGYEVVLTAPTGSEIAGRWAGDSLIVDPVLGKLFWGGAGGGAYRANLDGTDIEAISQLGEDALLQGAVFVPGNIDALCGKPAADVCPAGGDCGRVESIYWVEDSGSGHGVRRVRADGTQVETLHEWDQSDPAALALSRELGKVYWTRLPNEVFRANLDGSGVESVLQLPFGNQGDYPGGIALDPATGTLYVVQKRRDGLDVAFETATLWQANLDGSDLHVRAVLDTGPDPTLPGVTGFSGLGGPELNRQARFGYVTAADRVYRFGLDTTTVPELIVPSLPTALYPEGAGWQTDGSAHALQLDTKAGKLYWRQLFVFSGSTARTYRANLDGSDIELLPWTASPERIALALDAFSGRMYGRGLRDIGIPDQNAISRWGIEGGADFSLTAPNATVDRVNDIALLPAASGGGWARVSLIGVGGAPGLAAAPQLIDFGAVPVGVTAGPESVTLTSVGNEPVQVTDISSASAPFARAGGTCPATPFELAPGISCTLDYTFAPTVAAPFPVLQSLPVSSSGGNITLALIGVGIPAPPQLLVDPGNLASTLEPGDAVTLPLNLSNLGDETLDWAVTEGESIAGHLRRPSARVTLPETLMAPANAEGLISAAATGSDASAVAHPFPAARGDEVVLTHSSSLTIQVPNTPACGDGTTTMANQFLRTFTLADFDITTEFEVTEVTFGVESLRNVPSASITVNLYTLDGTFIYDNLTLIGSAVEVLTPQQQTLVTVPITGTAPAGSTLVVEIAAPDLTSVGAFFPGSNSLGETAPSYIASTTCGFPEPMPYTQVGPGFPNVHLVMTVSGAVAAPVDCTLPDWVDVDPMAGSLSGGGAQTVNVTFDADGLVAGDYTANLCFASNDPVQPLLPVPLTLTVTEAALVELSFGPTSLAFGEVEVGETSAPLTATLSNGGNAEATALAFDLSDGVFAADTSACGDTLSAGASCPITITFAPAAPGAITATLHVDSAEGAMADLDLAGTGIAATEADVGIAIDTTREYLRPGQMADYLVTLNNAGPGAASSASVASLLSPELDLGFASWLCVGPVTSGCMPAGQGDLADSGLAVPAGGSVTYLLSAPVRWDAQGPAETAASANQADDPNPANDSATAITPIALYRDGFEPYGGMAALTSLLRMDDALAATDTLTLQWPVIVSDLRIETVLAATPAPAGAAPTDPVFRLERFTAGPLGWVRLVARDAQGTEYASPWLPVSGTNATLAFADVEPTDDAPDEPRRTVLLFTADGELRLPLETWADAYQVWSSVPVAIHPLGDSGSD